MEDLAGIGGALVVGLIIGFLLGGLRGGRKAEVEAPAEPARNWWELRKTLTGRKAKKHTPNYSASRALGNSRSNSPPRCMT